MKKLAGIILSTLLFTSVALAAPAKPPLKLVQTITVPQVAGHFDHFAVDLENHRLFATPEDSKSVRVYDLKTGKAVHTMTGIGISHAVLYRPDLKQIYVTDGDDGTLKIFKGDTYELVKSVKLEKDADSIGYDAATKYLYIDNGGKDADMDHSLISVVDTTSGEKLADIRVDTKTLEAMAIEKGSARLFVNLRDKNQVGIIDREKRALVSTWSFTGATDNVAMAYDEATHRLFVACRSGQIVVLDSQSGKQIATLEITKGVDDMVFDSGKKRLYAACNGFVDVYEQTDADNYKSLGKTATGPLGKTALLVPELNRYFVAVPQHGKVAAKILVYEVQ